MAQEESVTEWLVALKADDSQAAQRIWDRYLEQVARLALRKLGTAPRRVADEYDIAIEVFQDLLQGIKEGRFSRLDNRRDLWQLLAMLAERRAISLRRRQLAQKRGGGAVRGESALEGKNAPTDAVGGMAHVPQPQPTPEFAVDLADTLNRILAELADEKTTLLVRDSLAGYTQAEMAQRLGISIPTVQRKLRLIRKRWEREIDP